MDRGKYLRGADGKRNALEAYTRMDGTANAWIRDIREMMDDDDEIIQAICDFTHAYYHSTDTQKPKRFKEAYAEWKKRNAHLMKGATPLTPPITTEYPPAPEESEEKE